MLDPAPYYVSRIDDLTPISRSSTSAAVILIRSPTENLNPFSYCLMTTQTARTHFVLVALAERRAACQRR